MPASNSQFFINLVKSFTPKAPGGTVFSDDMNEATDEIEGVQTVLGTGLRSRTVVSYSDTATSWSNLTARLNNMDAGIRSTAANVHPQYALVAATSLQPVNTGTVALTVTGFTASTQPLARFVAPDASVALQVNNTSLASKSLEVTGSLTVNSSSAVGGVFNADTAYTGDVLQVFKGATKTAYIQATGNTLLNNLTVAGTLSLGDFTSAQHDHSSAAQGGAVFPPGTMVMFAGASTSVPAGWLLCNGSAVSRTTFAPLFAALGVTYGAGDGSSTFNLPDLRSRFPQGASGTTGGSTGGASSVTLSLSNLPTHTHTINHDHGAATSGGASDTSVNFNMTTGKEDGNELSGTSVGYVTDGTGGGAGGTALTGTLAHTHSVNLPAFAGNSGSAGSSTAVTILPPFQTVHYIVKV